MSQPRCRWLHGPTHLQRAGHPCEVENVTQVSIVVLWERSTLKVSSFYALVITSRGNFDCQSQIGCDYQVAKEECVLFVQKDAPLPEAFAELAQLCCP
eukprot:464418-Amphidinium_carterae.1